MVELKISRHYSDIIPTIFRDCIQIEIYIIQLMFLLYNIIEADMSAALAALCGG